MSKFKDIKCVGFSVERKRGIIWTNYMSIKRRQYPSQVREVTVAWRNEGVWCHTKSQGISV